MRRRVPALPRLPYYIECVQWQLQGEFPQLVSYSRFVTLQQRVVLLLGAYAQYRCGQCTGIVFVDSTALRVCTNRRINRHKVFAGFRVQTRLAWLPTAGTEHLSYDTVHGRRGDGFNAFPIQPRPPNGKGSVAQHPVTNLRFRLRTYRRHDETAVEEDTWSSW